MSYHNPNSGPMQSMSSFHVYVAERAARGESLTSIMSGAIGDFGESKCARECLNIGDTAWNLALLKAAGLSAGITTSLPLGAHAGRVEDALRRLL